jgi:hypothetical protein
MPVSTDDRYSTTETAQLLGVSRRPVWYWASRWYPGRGHGNPIRLTPADVMAIRAILALTGGTSSAETDRQLIRTAVEAIRTGTPDRWLVLTRDAARFFATFEEAAPVAADYAWPVVAWLIDLNPQETDRG